MNNEAEGCLLIVAIVALILVIGSLIGAAIGESIADSRWQKEAVAAGHAEYVTQDGEPVWQWKPLVEKESGDE